MTHAVNTPNTSRYQLNRPKSLNAFGGKLLVETLNAVLELNDDPDTIFTVLTGEGRFFSAGADIRGENAQALKPQQQCQLTSYAEPRTIPILADENRGEAKIAATETLLKGNTPLLKVKYHCS